MEETPQSDSIPATSGLGGSTTNRGELEVNSSSPGASQSPGTECEQKTHTPADVKEKVTDAEKEGSDLSLYEVLRTDLLKCGICQDILQYPCILPCLHNFCGRCIDAKRETKGDQEEMTLECPTCTQTHQVPVGGFRCNHFLMNLAEVYETQQEDGKYCNYCQYEGKEVNAIGRCLECNDDLCISCRDAHKKTKLTRSHRIAPFDLIKLGQYDSDLRQGQKLKCNIHTTQQCDLYCETCNEYRCPQCKGCSKHKKTSIGEGDDKSYNLTAKDSVTLAKLLGERLPHYENYLDFLTKYDADLKQYAKEITDEVGNRAERLHELVDKFKDEILQELSSHIRESNSQLGSELRCIKSTSEGYKSNLYFLEQLVKYGKDDEIADLNKPLKERLQQVSAVSKHSICDQVNISLEVSSSNEETERMIKSLLGAVRKDKQPMASSMQEPGKEAEQNGSPITRNASNNNNWMRTSFMPKLLPKVQLSLEFNSHIATDSNNTWPTGVCTIPSGDIVICDRDNSAIKVFSANSGNLKSAFNGELEYKLCKPFDVASLSNGDLVVSDYGDESVKVFNSSGIGRLLIRGEFEYPRGVTTTDQDLILVLDSELGRVTIHNSTNGKLLKIVKGTNPVNSLIDPYYICITRLGDIMVTDFAEPNIKILNVKGEEIQLSGEYGVTNLQGLLQPYGCHQDEFGMTFIADNRNDRISVMMPNGEFEKHLISKKDGIWQPIALCIDGSGHLVVTEGLGKVKVFKYM